MASAGRKPGGAKTGGRQKGTPNKLASDVKAMILAALDKAGGAEYLLMQSEKNPTAFLALVGKVLPMQIANADGSNLAPATILIAPVAASGVRTEG